MKNFLLLLFVFISINSFGQTTKKEIIYSTSSVEVKPEFPGGIEKFHLYSIDSQKKDKSSEGFQGKVFVTFVVEKNGTLSNIKVIRDIGYGSGKEAIRILKNSPKWKPAKKDGKKVRCQYQCVLPIIMYETK